MTSITFNVPPAPALNRPPEVGDYYHSNGRVFLLARTDINGYSLIDLESGVRMGTKSSPGEMMAAVGEGYTYAKRVSITVQP